MFLKIKLTITLICIVHINIALAKECPDPEPIDNGGFEVLSTEHSLRVKYNCYPGYVLNGKQYRRCLLLGWDGKAPKCEPMLCGNPGEILNGYYEAPSVEFGSKATFYCDEGYRIIGKDSRFCTTEGWSGQIPTCKPIICDDLLPILYGKTPTPTYVANWEYGMVAKYSCIGDYSLIGAEELVCAGNGQWDKAPPICKAVNCIQPNSLANGQIVAGFGPRYKYRETITYRCDYAFELIGSNIIECTENNEFLPSPPTCKLSGCHPPMITPGAIITNKKAIYKLYEEITYNCHRGFKLVGSNVIQCMKNNTYVPPPPSCKPIICYLQSSIANGRSTPNKHSYRFGERVSYSCNPGFKLVGEHEIVCKENGIFQPSPPICHKVICYLRSSVVNGKRTPNKQSYRYGEHVRYSCNPGFKLVGENEIVCDENGIFQPSPPNCREIICYLQSSIDNGRSTPNKHSYRYGERVSYSCNPGFKLVGEHEIVCKENGIFQPSPPICRKVICYLWSSVVNGKRTPNKQSYRYGEHVRYSCNPGFKLVGENEIVCDENGIFQPSPPNCREIICYLQSSIANGRSTPNKHSYRFGERVSYSCNPGFKLVGEHEIVCKENGIFQPSPPICRKGDTISIRFMLKEIAALARIIAHGIEINIKAEHDLLMHEKESLKKLETILQKLNNFLTK